MTPELQNITTRAYKVFHVRISKPLEVCTACCVTDAEASALASMSVHHIPRELLYTYNHAARPAAPDLKEAKHFLPRYLELIAEFNYPSYELALALSRFQYYHRDDWTQEEWDLLTEFSTTFFKQCLANYPLNDQVYGFGERIDAILIMLAKANLDVETALEAWTQITTKESIFHFCDLVNHSFKSTKPNQLWNAFADDALSEKVVRWLNSKATCVAFAAAIERYIMDSELDDDKRRELSWAYETVQNQDTL